MLLVCPDKEGFEIMGMIEKKRGGEGVDSW